MINNYLRKIALNIQKNFNDYDKRLLKKGNESFFSPTYYPVFIIGPPRSGSTLLFQLITNNLKSIYFTNLMALLPKYILYTSIISNKEFYKSNKIRNNYYGYLNGLSAPNEGGKMFNKWFKQNGLSQQQNIRYTFTGLSNYFQLPIIAKPMTLINELNLIHQVLPEIRVIVISRDPLMNAQSLIIARKAINNTINKWWSTKPFNYEKVLDKSPFYQVFWQIQTIKNIIEQFIQKNNIDYLYISYEDLCNYPEASLLKIANKFDLKFKLNSFENIDNHRIKLNNFQKLNNLEWKKLNYYYKMFSKI